MKFFPRLFSSKPEKQSRKSQTNLARVAGLFGALALLPLIGQAQAQSQVVYDDALKNGWESWGWATLDYNDTSLVHSGSKAIKVSAGPDQAIYLHHGAQDSGNFQSLTFWINGGAGASNAGQRLQVEATLNNQTQSIVSLPPLAANTWQKVTIPLANLGVANKTNFDGFWIKNSVSSTIPSFWVDDIALDGTPAPTTLRIDVDAANSIRTIDGRLYGMNTAVWDQNFNGSATTNFLSAIKTTTMRFPGGSMANDYNWHSGRSVQNGGAFQWATSFADFARVASAQGAQAYICVNYGSGTPEQAAAWVAYANGSTSNNTVIGVDSKGRDWKTVGYWASIRASARLASDDGYNFLRASHPAPYGFKYWEIGNENYGNWEYDQHGDAGSGLTGAKYDPTTYANAFKIFSEKMRAVDSTVKLGAVVAKDQSPATGWTTGVLNRLKTLGVIPNFVIYHHYPQEPGQESDATLLQAGSKMGQEAATIRGLVNASLGATLGNTVELTMTELNSVTFNPGKQSTSLVNGLFLADSIASLSRTEFNAVVWWGLRNGIANGNNSSSLYGWRSFGDYGLVAAGDRSDTPANTPYPSYYGAKLLAQWGRGGDQVVAASSNYNLLSAHAAQLADGRLALLVVNKDPANPLSAQIALANYTPTGSASIFQYGKPNDATGSDLTVSSFGSVASNFNYTFPSYSMTVLVLSGSGSNNPNPTPTPTPQPTSTPVPVPTATPVATPTPQPTATPSPTATPVPNGGYQVIYTVTNQWSGGFNADVAIKNNGPAINGWTLAWKFAGNQQITNSWSSTFTQSGQNVTIKNAAWNGSIPTGGSVSFGFQATWSGSNPNPSAFTLNGAGTPTPTPTPITPTPTPVPTATPRPTATPTPQPTATPVPTPTPTTPPVSSGCKVAYTVTEQWSGGFNANVVIKNGGAAINGWTLKWKFAGNQQVTGAWNATATQSGQNATVQDAGWNKSIPTGGTASFGFQGSWSGSNAKPTAFTVNGSACSVE